MTEYTLDTITPGSSWGCRFRTVALVRSDGTLADNTGLAPGERAEGTPQTYEGVGIIRVRDLESRRLAVIDVESGREFVVDETDTWDYDRVEYTDQT